MNASYETEDRFALRQLLPCNFSRKRGRTCDDSCEFTPISKRINNLHIRSCLLNAEENANDSECIKHPTCHCSEAGPSSEYRLLEGGVPAEIHPRVQLPDGSYVNLPSSLMAGASNEVHYVSKPHPDFMYNPELSPTENPHYYQANGLLFDCHLHRMQRSGKMGIQ